MSAERRSFWGTAFGLDLSGGKQRINIFKASGGFHFVDENLDSYYRQLPSADYVKTEIATLFRLRDVKLDIPHLGIYSSQKTPKAPPPVKSAAAPVAKPDAWGPVAKPDAWGNVLVTKKPKR